VYSLTNLNYSGNGDVTSANDSANTNWTYQYDDFNRLAQATNTSPTPHQVYQYLYDRFGNRWQQNQGQGTNYQIQLTFNANNQINGMIGVNVNPYQYDAAGNLQMDGQNCYSYDAENRLSSVVPKVFVPSTGLWVCGSPGATSARSYLYDPDGRRVAKLQNGSISEQYYYDAGGHMITDADASGNTLRAEIFAGGRHLATWTNNATYFNHADWLGTERVRTNSSGSTCQIISSLPFGDGQNITGACGGGDPSPNHFTGKERDSESGLDNFGARHNASSAGRFLQPDPGPYVWADPQTLNRYAYTRNNPLKFVDPTDKYFAISPSDPHYAQYQAAIADMLLSPRGRAVVAQIARDPRPSFYASGPIQQKPGYSTAGVTTGKEAPSIDIGGTRTSNTKAPIVGTTTTIDFSQLPIVNANAPRVDLQGEDTFIHESYHVSWQLQGATFEESGMLGEAGDIPKSITGPAENFAQTVQSDAAGILNAPGLAVFASQASWQEAGDVLQQGLEQYFRDVAKALAFAGICAF